MPVPSPVPADDEINALDPDDLKGDGWEEETSELTSLSPGPKPMTTDLVRLYLQDIGRVPLLKKDEEVQKAQQIQQSICFLDDQGQSAKFKPKPYKSCANPADAIKSAIILSLCTLIKILD